MNLDFLKHVLSPKISFIVTFSVFFFYLSWVNFLNKDVNAISDGIVFPTLIAWAVFLSASLVHVFISIYKLVFVVFRYFHSRFLKSKKDKRIKKEADVYINLLTPDELNILFELLLSQECTGRLSLYDNEVLKLINLGIVIKKEKISAGDFVCFLNPVFFDAVEEKFIPLYFDNARLRFDKDNVRHVEVVDFFYSQDEDVVKELSGDILNYISHFERFGLLHKYSNKEVGEATLYLDNYFVIYLEKVYGRKPVRKSVNCQI